MKAFVTGGAGFIGSNLAARLVRDGHHVTVYDNLSTGQERFLEKYGFGSARAYLLVVGDREYDSKAIVGAAHGYQFPQLGPLAATQFSGGAATVQPLLEGLGFEVRVATDGMPPSGVGDSEEFHPPQPAKEPRP